ncbi:MAG: hypothetical protein ABH896_03295 [Candidatus Jacksonbacteria bacterium]
MLWPVHAKILACKQSEYLGLRFENKGTTAKPKLRLTIWPPKAINKTSEQKLRDLKIGYRAKFIDADKKWGKWKNLALHYIWEDIFWQRKHKKIEWLEKEIRR